MPDKTRVMIRRNTTVNSLSLTGYDFRIGRADEDDPITGDLRQVGPVRNDHVIYAGVFASRETALRAALGYLPGCMIAERESFDGEQPYTSVYIRRSGRLLDGERVLAAKTRRGIFLAARHAPSAKG